jgi:hypothetical protein
MGFSFSRGEEGTTFLKSKENTGTFFLDRHAISQEQYNKSLHDMTVKMGISQSASATGGKNEISRNRF